MDKPEQQPTEGQQTPPDQDAAAGAGEAGAQEATGAGAEGQERSEQGKERADQGKEQPPGFDDRVTYIRQLERKLTETQDTLSKYIQAYKGTQQEQEEFKRRLERENAKALEILRGKLIGDLLELMDNLDRSVMGAQTSRNYDALATGIQIVQGQFLQKLEAIGARVIPTVGQPFDPRFHEALTTENTDDPAKDGVVTMEFTRGFAHGDRVLRPARVQVGRLVS